MARTQLTVESILIGKNTFWVIGNGVKFWSNSCGHFTDDANDVSFYMDESYANTKAAQIANANPACYSFGPPYKIERISNFGNDGYIVRHEELGLLKYIDVGCKKWLWEPCKWGNAFIFGNWDYARNQAEKMLSE